MRFVSLAWRNELRNPRRTALTIASVALGVAGLVFAWSLFDGSNEQMISSMTSNFSGFVQVHAAGYTDDPSIDRTFGEEELDPAVISATPGVVAWTGRLEAGALVSSTANSRGVLVVGVDPAREPAVTTLHTKLVQGSYLGEPGGILVGKSLAKALEVGLGGELAVLTQGARGSIGAGRYRVIGIYDTQNDMVDGMQAFVSLQDARQLLDAPAELTSVAMRLSERRASDPAITYLHAALGERFEVKDWMALLPEVAQEVAFHEAVGYFLMVFLLGIVTIGVANSLFMSVSERVREFGVMMALGTTPRQVFRLICYEGMLVGGLGFGAGILVGFALVAYFGAVGIDFSSTADVVQTMQGVTKTLVPRIDVKHMLVLGSCVLGSAVLAAIYPAIRTAGLVPIAAIRGRNRAAGGAPLSSGALSRGLLATLSLRNVMRQPLRTILTGAAITFGLGAFVFLGAFSNGYYKQMVENSTGMLTGDAQIQHQDFRTDMKPKLALADGDALLAKVRQSGLVAAASPRVQGPAVLSSAARAETVMMVGVDPATERDVTFLYKSVKDGAYLTPSDVHGVVIGRKLAERLRVGVGERVVATTQDLAGNLSSASFTVVGTFDTGSHGFDEVMAHVPLHAMQGLLGMTSDRYTGIALRAFDREAMAPALAGVARLVPSPEVRVLPWQVLVPEVAQMSEIFKKSLVAVLMVVFVMVGIVVANTILMSVLERTREFGMMLALGSRPWLIVRMVLLESLLIGLVGTVIGAGLGGLAAKLHETEGVSMAGHGMTALPGVTDMVYPKLTAMVLFAPSLLLPVLVLIAAIYPALRASRLEPVKALRST